MGLDEEGFFCEDRIEFDGEGEVSFSLMCRDEWTPVGENGGYRIGERGAAVYPDPGLTVTSDRVALESKLSREWGTDSLVRVRLTSEPFGKRTFVLRVKLEKDCG